MKKNHFIPLFAVFTLFFSTFLFGDTLVRHSETRLSIQCPENYHVNNAAVDFVITSPTSNIILRCFPIERRNVNKYDFKAFTNTQS